MDVKFVDEVRQEDVKNRRIELTKTVEQKESFTIAQLEQQIVNIDNQIARMETEKVTLQDKLTEVKTALDIK